jgi:hypothetical protein
MTTVDIEYPNDENSIVRVHGEFDDATEAVKWVVSSLGGWCVDNDVRVYINGERFW